MYSNLCVTWKDSRYNAAGAGAVAVLYLFMGSLFFSSSSECQQLHFTCFWETVLQKMGKDATLLYTYILTYLYILVCVRVCVCVCVVFIGKTTTMFVATCLGTRIKCSKSLFLLESNLAGDMAENMDHRITANRVSRSMKTKMQNTFLNFI
jgi:hypothetical protein